MHREHTLCIKIPLISSCLPSTENKKPCQEPVAIGGVCTLDLGFLFFCIFFKEEKGYSVSSAFL